MKLWVQLGPTSTIFTKLGLILGQQTPKRPKALDINEVFDYDMIVNQYERKSILRNDDISKWSTLGENIPKSL